ncbi:MAG: hydroxymethylbilane synthase [Pseudomonadota bacterium]
MASLEVIRIATRQSKLALWQAHFISDQLRAAHPGLRVELHGITTKGDKWLQAPLSEVGGKGLFVKELEAAMLAGEADIAVHSAKDLPAVLAPEFELPVFAFRAPVHDVLVSPLGDVEALPAGARVGSASLRRQAQLLARRPDLSVRPIRGNVDTRLAKLADGEYDAIVLAAAGLQRLGLTVEGVYPMSVENSLPAPGQGALAIECVADSPVVELLSPLQDARVAACVTAERGISAGLGADCSLPVAALAQMEDEQINLRALLASADGQNILQATASGTQPHRVADAAVAQLFAQGAAGILQQLREAGAE